MTPTPSNPNLFPSPAQPTLTLPSQPARLSVTQPASQPYRHPANQPAFPLPSQPASLTASQPATYLYQPASLPNPQTHTPPPCLSGLLVYRGGLFLTLTFHQNWGGNGLIHSECFGSGFSMPFFACFRTRFSVKRCQHCSNNASGSRKTTGRWWPPVRFIVVCSVFWCLER